MRYEPKDYSKTIDVRAITARIQELSQQMGAAMETGDAKTYNALQPEYNNLIDLMDSMTGYKGVMYENPGGAMSREEMVGNWDKFLASKKKDPSDPYDVPPSMAPIPQRDPRMPAPPPPQPKDPYANLTPLTPKDPALAPRKVEVQKYNAGGLVSLLPDQMLSSPFLNSYAARDEAGIRGLMRMTDAQSYADGGLAEDKYVPGTIFRKGSILGNAVERNRAQAASPAQAIIPDSGDSILQRFWRWRTQGADTEALPRGKSAWDLGREGVARGVGQEWSDMPVDPLPPEVGAPGMPQRTDPYTGKPVVGDPRDVPGSTMPSLYPSPDAADRQRSADDAGRIARMQEEARKQREQKEGFERGLKEDEARQQRLQDLKDEMELRKSLYPEFPRSEYPMVSKEQEAERMKHLANTQIFASMMQAAGGDFAPMGRGFAAAGDKYEQGYDRYQRALLGKAAWDRQQDLDQYRIDSGMADDVLSGEQAARSAAATRQQALQDKQDEYNRELGRKAIEIQAEREKQGKAAIADLYKQPGFDPEANAIHAAQLKRIMQLYGMDVGRQTIDVR